MYIDNDSWTSISISEILNSLRLSTALKSSWGEDTSYPDDAKNWTQDNPSIGQCAATSVVAQDFLRGDIHKNSAYYHYWNQLPSGSFVDFTHDQFGINEPIVSQGKIKKKNLLKGKKANQALTPQRYKILRKRVKKKLKYLKPTLFLLSSNAQPEYIHDIIETMGLPHGTIQHFRYKLNYVDKPLRKLIPVKGNNQSKYLLGKEAIIIYLNQKRISSRVYKWNKSIPIRTGIIRECYKTGDEDNSIAHFFFEVRESLLHTDVYNKQFPQIFGKSYEKSYTFLTFEDTTNLVTKHQTGKIFEKQCEQIKNIGFTYENEKIKNEYEPPLLILFEGLFKKKRFENSENEVKPKFDASVPKSYYQLAEGISYRYRFRTYGWEFREPYEIKLKVSQKLFNTPEEYSLVVKSSYDSECWELTPSFIEQNTLGYMTLDIKNIVSSKENHSQLTELDWIIFTIFELKRRFMPRFLDIFSDLLFVLGPVYLALIKFLDNIPIKTSWIESWEITLIGIYSTWFLVKLARRWISG